MDRHGTSWYHIFLTRTLHWTAIGHIFFAMFQQSLQLLLWLQLSQCCKVRYTRIELDRSGNSRSGRSQKNQTKRGARDLDPGSCLVRFPSDPLGQKAGDPRATACDRTLGVYNSPTGLKRVSPSPYAFKIEGSNGVVDSCEIKCMRRDECKVYLFDCQLSICTLFMGTIDGGPLDNTRYVSGVKSLKAPNECHNDAIRARSNDTKIGKY